MEDKRLTRRDAKGEVIEPRNRMEAWRMAKRLAAYEDTEMEPEAGVQLKQIADIFNCDPNDPAQLKVLLDKLRGWQQRGQNALRVRVGDTLWYVTRFGRIKSTKIKAFVIGHRSTNIVRTEKWDIEMGQIGKSVFLSRQEAEAAVEQMKGEGENG